MELRLNTTPLTTLAAHARKVAPDATKRSLAALRAGGELVAEDAKQRSSWSTRIPGTIKVRRSGATIRVSAGPGTFPHAGEAPAFEHGGVAGTFRHPVGGNRNNWVDQQARPFLTPAADAQVEKIGALFLQAADELWSEL